MAAKTSLRTICSTRGQERGIIRFVSKSEANTNCRELGWPGFVEEKGFEFNYGDLHQGSDRD
jgi:hypothetical protein